MQGGEIAIMSKGLQVSFFSPLTFKLQRCNLFSCHQERRRRQEEEEKLRRETDEEWLKIAQKKVCINHIYRLGSDDTASSLS